MSARSIGRYQVYEAFASGGMASVHLGRMKGQAGFAKTVAVKQLHASFAEDPATVSSILDEARLASRIQHPNVVATLDVIADGPDILLVLEYVHGESLARLLRHSESPPPIAVANAVVAALLHGLHAAHEATAESGEPLGIVHRDVSPQNVLVGVDGLARVLDFGIAKARGRLQTTREGQVKGKLAYMAPEQIRLGEVSRRTDVFAAGIVLWEALTGERLFAGENEGHVMTKVLEASIAPPSSLRRDVDPALDAVVLRALNRNPEERFATARAFALALEEQGPIAPASQVGAWVEGVARAVLEERAARVSSIERTGEDREATRERAADLVTLTDAAASAQEVTRTETRGVSIEPGVREPTRTSRKPVLLGVGVAALAIAGSAALWLTRAGEPTRTEAAFVVGSVVPAPSSSATNQAVAPPPTPASPQPQPSASSDPSPPQPPVRTGGPPRTRVPSPKAAAPAPPPSSGKPFYRFE